MSNRRALILLFAGIGISACLALGQTSPTASFDAVAVKRWNMERGQSGVNVSGARLEANAVTLKDLIAEAYGVNEQDIAGAAN